MHHISKGVIYKIHCITSNLMDIITNFYEQFMKFPTYYTKIFVVLQWELLGIKNSQPLWPINGWEI